MESGLWYSDAVAWADKNGIVAGYGNGSFGLSH
ncbi:MAG: S-layer homology domain-containing protein [Oscillospiraceae bacterium]